MISFPPDVYKKNGTDDFNPAIRTFGRRFGDDQQVTDLVAELMLVFSSDKEAHREFSSVFPPVDVLDVWRNNSALLRYFPKYRLNLKLFAFLSSSQLETRHTTHRNHAVELNNGLKDKIDAANLSEKEELIRTMSNLFLGFWGNGAKRTWCAQTFYPFSSHVLGGEVIWGEAAAKKIAPQNWEDVLDQFNKLFATEKHIFFARGGEALYLQLCNVFTQTKDEISTWCDECGIDGFTEEELDPVKLRDGLEAGIVKFFNATPKMLGKVLDFIDTGIEDETARKSDRDSYDEPRAITCGWIPYESWREGFLFAVELKRIFKANLGVMETVEMLKIACAMQVMRTLAAQTYRNSRTKNGRSDGLDYRILICDPSGKNQRIKDFSWKSYGEISREIQQVIRTPELIQEVEAFCANRANVRSDPKKVYDDADKYGYKLYRRIGKSIGLIVPPTGKFMRYTINEKILRYLVVSLIPGERMTLETFKKQVMRHHGIVFDLAALSESRNWKHRKNELEGDDSSNEFLEKMLEASGTLVRLSDSCSLVKNPYVDNEAE